MMFRSLFREWKELSRFKKLSRERRSIVFYSEDFSSWAYYEPIIRELTGPLNQHICYISSSKNDAVLDFENENITAFCIGSGSVRTAFFSTLEADVMVMTMPDLGTYHIKRSKAPVHYAYVFHSLISTHMSYRYKAFDQFDSVFCVGPHHKDEIRATEQLYGLSPKILVEAGYGKLDSILDAEKSSESLSENRKGQPNRVLVAPSWGEHSLLENQGPDLVELLLEASYDVTVRPHIMTIRNRQTILSKLQKRFGSNVNFRLDLEPSSQGAMQEYDLLVADWGGSALEFAFGLEKPVLFVDVPRKVFNPNYQQIPCVPMEIQVRSKIGDVVSLDRLEEVPNRIENLLRDPDGRKDQIRNARSEWIYNLRTSGKVCAEYISHTAQSFRDGRHAAQNVAPSPNRSIRTSKS